MKSLEIVNERIEDLESRLESANYLANGNPSEFGKIFIGDLSKQLNGFKQIKQDLEVLEIIRKKDVNLSKLKLLLLKLKEGHFEDINDVYIAYNTLLFDAKHLTMEELLKLKQWLEENE